MSLPALGGFGGDQDEHPLVGRIKVAVFDYYLSNGITTDDELHAIIRIFLGYNVARVSQCDNHVAPFSFIADQYFERHNDVIGFANRTGGKTLNVAILNVIEAIFKGNLEILSAGAVQEQAKRGYTYFSDMMTGNPQMAMQVISMNQQMTLLSNQAKVGIIMATWAGFNSPHPQKLRVDEIEMVAWRVLMQGLSMPISNDHWQQGTCLTSTRKVMSGTMQHMLDEADTRGFKVYNWCIFDVLEKCTRECHDDPVYGDCPIYSFKDADGTEKVVCGGRAHDLPEDNGFYKIADFVSKVKVLDHETVEAEWLNESPMAGRLVYGRYFQDEAPWVIMPDEQQEILAHIKAENWFRFGAIDFGAHTHVTLCALDEVANIFYVYAEYWSADENLTLLKHGQQIQASDPLGWQPNTVMYADPSRPDMILELKSMIDTSRVYCYPAANAVEAGVNLVKTLLQGQGYRQPRLRIFQGCHRLRKEFSELYVHPEDKNGEILRDKFIKKDDHAADSCRYALYSHHFIGITNSVVEKDLEGVW